MKPTVVSAPEGRKHGVLFAALLFGGAFALGHFGPIPLRPIASAHAADECGGCGGGGSHEAGGGHETGGGHEGAKGGKGAKGRGGATGGHQPSDMGHRGSSSHGGGSKSLESNVFHAPGGEEEEHEGGKGKGKGGSGGHEEGGEGTEHAPQ